MTRERAIAEAGKIKRLVQAKGVEAVIDLKPGRPWAGNDWWSPHFIGHLGHHVVSRRSQGLTPFYHLVRNGRSDLPGPLSQFYIGFDGVLRIITLGLANHPGSGGPWTLPGGTIPRDNARAFLVGTEVEGGLDWADWPAGFRDVQARAFAAILEWLGRDERSHGEHGNPWARGRKVDRIRYYQQLARARREIRAHLGTTTPRPQEDDVARRGDEGSFVKKAQFSMWGGFVTFGFGRRLQERAGMAGVKRGEWCDGVYGTNTVRAAKILQRRVIWRNHKDVDDGEWTGDDTARLHAVAVQRDLGPRLREAERLIGELGDDATLDDIQAELDRLVGAVGDVGDELAS